MEIIFEFTSGSLEGKKFKFYEDNVLAGRSDDADLTVTDDLVSYEHCRFTVKADGLYLTDLGSSNGTYVNGTRHDSGFISFGDRISFGEGGPEAVVTFAESERKSAKSKSAESPQAVIRALRITVDNGQSLDFGPGRISIGRDDSCDITLDHGMVSRNHAEIDFSKSGIRINDLGSTNGTFVNGSQTQSAEIRESDTVVIGKDGPGLKFSLLDKKVHHKKSVSARAILIPLVIILILLGAGAVYKFVYVPGSQKKAVETKNLNEYVTMRLVQLSKDLGDEQDEIPLIFVENVVKYIEKFTSNLRNWFEKSLERSELHIGMVRRMLRGAGLPEEFAYLAFIESGYDSAATSPAGARGLWQFMPATAGDFGLKVQKGKIDERINAKKSTEAACKYIKQLYNLYNSYMLAMASYNTGQGRIANALMRMDVIDQNRFWYLVKNNMLHDETMEYVPKIMAAMIIATDPERFGFAKAVDEQ